MMQREAYLASRLGKMVCAMLRSGTVSWGSRNAGHLAEFGMSLSPAQRSLPDAESRDRMSGQSQTSASGEAAGSAAER